VKLLFDENPSPDLAAALADLYPESEHVHHCGLGSSDDLAVWGYAKGNGFAIVSKDSDFQERSVLQGHPPKIIWLRVGNCASAEIEVLLRSASSAITRFGAQEQERAWFLSGVRESLVASTLIRGKSSDSHRDLRV
jgi:predicted nuclease of predicted toxin-antitoxin system